MLALRNMMATYRRADLMALAAVVLIAVTVAYEAAVALRWIPVGKLSGEGPRFEGFFALAGGIGLITGFVASLFLGVASHRRTPGVLLGALGAALVTAHAYTFNTYDLPTLVRYVDSGAPSATWVAWVVAAGLLSSLFSVMFPAIGFVMTAAVLAVCLFTYWFTGCCN